MALNLGDGTGIDKTVQRLTRPEGPARPGALPPAPAIAPKTGTGKAAAAGAGGGTSGFVPAGPVTISSSDGIFSLTFATTLETTINAVTYKIPVVQ